MMSGSGNLSSGKPSSRRRRGSGTARRAMSAIALGPLLGLFLTTCIPPKNNGEPETGPTSCVAPADAEMQDVDPEDSPVKPWQKQPGDELVVEFETGRLSARYAGMVTDATTIWSKSSRLNAVAVQTCSNGANCVTMVEDNGRSRNTDGEMDWQGDGDYMESSTITLYTQALERTTDNWALATIVHEMGHAHGLDHRLDRSDLMNSVTGDNTNPEPDAVNFANLATIYGP